MSRLKDRYRTEIAPTLKKEFGYKNVMAIPRLEKIVVNMGLGEASQNAKVADTGADEIGRITGQKAVVRRATKSIAVLSRSSTSCQRTNGSTTRSKMPWSRICFFKASTRSVRRL